jgi:hypothetical protein
MVGEEPSKASFSILGVSPRKVTALRPLHRKKALPPMLVTLLGIMILFRLGQLQKALSPMLVTLSGILMLVRLV